ncbi:carboxypeptidase-like regulatory domain-containing protein [Zobellia uliginosa]|uniref:carboxypeptidase-like regulatory domain-containing protein n=1 Tax=Zobellia uliginosa TaxID=143224 RepID=UPI001C072DC0|nr:carboxypeptidase-like regulatory domain-containing protein [Zobellia uliginosa]
MAVAQKDFTVTGTLIDDFNVPLPGASVIEKGATNGVSTNFDGTLNAEEAEAYWQSFAKQNQVELINK